MAEIVNLRRARKSRARDEKEAQAATNRARFGEAKPVRDLRQAREQQRSERLAAHLRKVKDDVEER